VGDWAKTDVAAAREAEMRRRFFIMIRVNKDRQSLARGGLGVE